MNEPLITGRHPELGLMYAAIDPDVRFVEPAVRASKLGARLAPFRSEDEARAALEAAGAVVDDQ